MPGMHLAFTLHNVLIRWNLSAFALCSIAVLIAIAVWYLGAEWRLALRGRRWPVARTLSFLAGLLVAALAVSSSVAVLAMSYFQAHVVQHLMLMVVAPPLLALGAPSTLLLQTASRTTKERWLSVLRSQPFRALTHPVVVWFFYFGVMFVFFLTPLINVAMHHMALMDALNVGFLFGGTLYWWPMVGVDPIVHWKMSYGMRLLNLLIGSAVEAFLGVAILAAAHPAATMYTLSSTHSGGALLWVSTEVSTLGGFIPIFIQWIRAEERLGARADLSAEKRAAQLSPVSASALSTRRPENTRQGAGTGAWEAAWIAKFGRLPGGTVDVPGPPSP